MSKVTPINLQVAAEAYFRRHGRPGSRITSLVEGLSITQNEDGLWLNFGKAGGLQASVHMDMIGPNHGDGDSLVRKAIDAWQADYAMAKDH